MTLKYLLSVNNKTDSLALRNIYLETISYTKMCCECCSVRQQKIWVITIGILSVVIGTVLIIIWPGITDSIINNKLPISPTSWMFQHWLNPPVTAYMFIYLFNWTNLQDATNRNVKPNFMQVGPYVFREEKVKEDVTFHNNDTLTFYGRRTWFFEKDMSSGSLNDLITLPHPPSVVAASTVRNWNRYIKKILNYALNTEGGSLAFTKTVDEWLFKGFYDPLAEFAMLLQSKLIPWPYKEFGFFVGRNASKVYEGAYTIHTGQTDLSMLGEISHWRGSTQSYAFSSECGRVNGSTGDIFVPARGPAETVSLFIPDACRSINMFPGERKRIRGIDTVKYSTNSMSFDSGQLYPNMECFCSQKSEGCARTGALDLGPCLFGAPLYLSHPHFWNADPSYAATISGMKPNSEDHGFYIYMEPKLGVPVKVNASMQISMRLKDDDIIEIFQNLNEFFAPMVIISERGDLEENMAKTVRFALKTTAIGVGCAIALVVVGIIFLLTAIFLTYTKRCQKYYA